MNPRMIISMAVATMSLIFAVGCSSDAKKKSSEPKKAEAPQEMMSDHYTSLAFDPGETRLSGMDKRNLQNLAAQIRQSGKQVDDIKIVTWSDKEYKKANQASSYDVILARQRAESIKNYLQNDLMSHADIDYYNMAQQPAPLSRYFKAKDESVEKLFKKNNDLNMTSDSRASKAVVIIEYEGTNTNL
jgi:hypothetical protein